MVTEQAGEGVAEEGVDLRLAGGIAGGVKVAEKVNNFFGFEVDALDFVVRTAAFDGGPFNDGSAAGNGFAHVGLLENLFEAGAGERGRGRLVLRIAYCVLRIRRGRGRRYRGAGLLGELVEESVVAFVGGPDGHVEAPSDAALGGLPEKFGIWMPGEFVEADIAAINGHGLWMSGEGNDAGAVIKFDVADFDFFGKAGRAAIGVGAVHFESVLTVRNDGFGEIEEFG